MILLNGKQIDAPSIDILPIGIICEMGQGNEETVIPYGWMNCNGSAINRSIYKDLFSKIGTKYGDGDGLTTFNIPNTTTTTHVYIIKVLNINMNVDLQDIIPIGGDKNQVLTKGSTGDYDLVWADGGSGSGIETLTGTAEVPLVLWQWYHNDLLSTGAYLITGYFKPILDADMILIEDKALMIVEAPIITYSDDDHLYVTLYSSSDEYLGNKIISYKITNNTYKEIKGTESNSIVRWF